ncbi:hypothetical protein WJX72_001079 [[Myrmecia] bisecta]|uniref:Phosphotyrosine protein phosphatase I domain-containing protein n=1 Tax=[Myrmecia] bisecta TaxID=41462 RepID=A0AAW1QQ68_9CHLO
MSAPASQAAGQRQQKHAGEKTKVLFVCLGNICRSPSAEAVFKTVVDRAGVTDAFHIDSCGTGGGSRNWYQPGGFAYHVGDPADPRMNQAAKARGIALTSRSRPLRPEDLVDYDLIIGMDSANVAEIQVAADFWASQHDIPTNYREKVKLMCSFLTSNKFKGALEVPDPYYGGKAGFERVLDLLEDACEGLLATIQDGNGHGS